MPQEKNDKDQPQGLRRAEFLRGAASVGLAVGLSGGVSPASAQDAPPVSRDAASPKPATRATRDVNAMYRQGLPFDDTHDFADARRGLLASLPDPVVIRNSQGVPVWDTTSYNFIKVTETDDAPDTVNPSLWRMAKLNMIHGLFEVVADGIWQVRGYDLSVMSIIRTNTGYIVIDPLISQEVSQTVWQQLVVPKLVISLSSPSSIRTAMLTTTAVSGHS
jgi:alkyl sulfatase BDS1-like metallo-beta-lactamase superfamily hydrolase